MKLFRPFAVRLLATLCFLVACSATAGDVHQWGVYEQSLQAKSAWEHPLWDVKVRVNLTAPSGKTQHVEAFWYDAREWRFRFSPAETGRWKWRTECVAGMDAGLSGKEGAFDCTPYQGTNPLYRHGALRIAQTGTFIEHADRTPFFWMADTAWNGALLSTPADWEEYLKARARQQFNVIQCVLTQWRGARTNLSQPMFHTNGTRLAISPELCRQLDDRLARVNAHGLVAAPVMLWALTPPDPGRALHERDAIVLARYIAARWGALQVVWFLGGDGQYGGSVAPRWHAIGRAVFGGKKDRLATLHPAGSSWIRGEFVRDDWYDFVGYQSSHNTSEKLLRWMTEGPPATEWKEPPVKPFINLEPNYELHSARGGFSDFDVRRASYWSVLVSPSAGVSYGNTPVWNWNVTPALSEGHERLGQVQPWRAGLDTPGIRSMTHLVTFFQSGPWHELRPAPDVLAEKPAEVAKFIAASKTRDGSWAVLYTPAGGNLNVQGLQPGLVARWFNPRTGEWKEAGPLTSTSGQFQAPDTQDWLLELK